MSANGIANQMALEGGDGLAQGFGNIALGIVQSDGFRHRAPAAARGKRSPFGDMAKLAHIAWPVMGQEG